MKAEAVEEQTVWEKGPGVANQRGVGAAVRGVWRVPLFAVSGYSNDPIMGRPSDFGFADSLPKPFTSEQLSAMLARTFLKGH